MTKTRRAYAPTRAVRVALQDGPLPLDEIHKRCLQLQADLSPKFINRVVRRGLRGSDAWLAQLEDERIAIKGGSAA